MKSFRRVRTVTSGSRSTASARFARGRFRWVLLAMMLAGRGAAAGQSGDAPWGPPFGQRSLYVLHAPLLDFAPADPDVPARGGFRVALESAYANSFSHSWHASLYHRALGPAGTPFRQDEALAIHRDFPNETAWFVDADLLRTSLKADVAISPATYVSVEVPYLSREAITADRFIYSFHRAFGLSQAGREAFPRGAFLVMLQPANGPLEFASSGSSGVGDVQGTFSWRPPPLDSKTSLGVDVAVKAPTGSARDFNGSGRWDGGLLVFLARSGARWRVETEASVVFPGGWSAPVQIETSPFVRLFLSATRRFGPRTRIGVSVTAAQSPFRSARLGAVSHIGSEVALGLERDISRWSARMTVTEHIAAAGDRADVGLSLRLAYRR